MLQGVWMRVAGARVEQIQVVHLKSPPPPWPRVDHLLREVRGAGESVYGCGRCVR